MSRWSRRARGLWTAACLLTWLGLAAIPALAADPTPSPAGGDVRTSATAPGLVGDLGRSPDGLLGQRHQALVERGRVHTQLVKALPQTKRHRLDLLVEN